MTLGVRPDRIPFEESGAAPARAAPDLDPRNTEGTPPPACPSTRGQSSSVDPRIARFPWPRLPTLALVSSSELRRRSIPAVPVSCSWYRRRGCCLVRQPRLQTYYTRPCRLVAGRSRSRPVHQAGRCLSQPEFRVGAGCGRGRIGLSRRRSQVRVPSLPSFDVPARRDLLLSK